MNKIYTKLLMGLFLVLGTLGANAQTYSNYAVAQTFGNTYTSISGTGLTPSATGAWRNALSTDDNLSAVLPIGFTFNYMGTPYTNFSMSTNGFLTFNTGTTATGSGTLAYGYQNTQFSATSGTVSTLAPFYDDQQTANNAGTLADLDASMKYLTTGIAGSRILTVEWINMQDFSSTSTSSFNYQVKLYESDGHIEFNYGTFTLSNTGTITTMTYSLGVNNASISATPTPTELLTQQVANTVPFSNTPSNALGGATPSNMPTAGTRYNFLYQAPSPASPTGINYTAVTATNITVNWTDASTTETYFILTRATDAAFTQGVVTTTVGSTTFAGTGGTISSTQSGLAPGTTYYFKVVAANESSAPSAATVGASQATLPAGNISSVVAGGNWSVPATWSGGVVPTSADNVTITDGSTVTIDITTATAYTLTVGTGGAAAILQYDNTTTAKTLTVLNDVTINTNGSIRSNTTSPASVTSHVLSLGGNMSVNGTGILNGSASANSKMNITFTGAASNTFTTSATSVVSFNTVTLSKGAAANILDFTPGATWTATAGSQGFSITAGTLKISGSATINNQVFNVAAYTIPALGSFWLNNVNFTVSGQNGSPTNLGLIRISNGIFNIGTATGNSMSGATGQYLFDGGTVNLASRLTCSGAGIYTQSAGVVNVTTVVGGNSSTSAGGLDFSSTTSTVNISGGTINLVTASTATTPLDYRFASSTINITGGILNVGTAATATNFNFRLSGAAPAIVIDNTTNNKTATLFAAVSAYGNVTVNPGATLALNALTFTERGSTITNNGIFSLGSGTLTMLTFSASLPQSITGSGTITGNLATLSVQNLSGVTITHTNQIPTLRVNMFYGNITGASKITIGTGGTLAALTQISSAGATTTGGSYDVSPLFNLGTGTYTVLYIQEGTPRTTGFEIPATRILTAATISTSNNVTVAGGALAIGTLTLTAGNLVTSSSNLVTITGATTTSTVRSTYTSASGATSSGTNITVGSTTNLVVGMNISITSGTGAFAPGTTVTSITSTTVFVVSAPPTTPLSASAVVTGVGGYVSGPLAITLPPNLTGTTTYNFPIGKSGYNGLDLVNVSTGATGPVLLAEVFDANSGGTAGVNLSAINTNRYWTASVTSGNFTSAFIKLTEQSAATLGTANAIGGSATQAGAYDLQGGTGITTTTSTTVQTAAVLTSLPGYFALGLKAVPMSYTSSTTTQTVTTGVLTNTVNQQIIGLQIVATGNTNPLTATSFTLSTNGSTAPGTDISNAKLYYTGTSSTFATTTQFGVTVSPSGSFVITGSQALLEGTNYFWLTYDVPNTAVTNDLLDAEFNSVTLSSGSQVPTVQAPTGSRIIKAPLNGVYTIGASQAAPNYTNLTNAVSDLNLYGVSGSVIFQLAGDYSSTYTSTAGATSSGTTVTVGSTSNLTPGMVVTVTAGIGTFAANTTVTSITNSTTFIVSASPTTALSGGGSVVTGSEIYPLAINPIIGGSATNTLTIKPAVSTIATISGSSSNALIKINGASYVTIDGSNSGSTDQSLTITNTSTASSTAGVWVASGGLAAGSTNDVIKNLKISTGSSSVVTYGVSVSGSTIGSAGSDNDNITIQNNNITVATNGIYANGSASVSAGGLDNLQIIGNSVTNNSSTTTIGIQVGNALNSNVSQNTLSIQNSSSTPVGISLETGFVSSTVSKNMITKVLTTSTAGYGGRGITVGTGTATSNVTISNNVIYGVNGSNYTSFGISSSAGIAIGVIGNSSTLTTVSGGVNLYYNSVSLTGNSSYSSATITTALYVGSGATALDIRNNVFANSLTATTTGSKDYAVYSAAAATAFTLINYNDYYVVTSANATGVIGFIGADKTTLATFQSATGQDANSIAVDPLFNSTTNLQPQSGSPLVAAGVTIPSVSADFTGFTRGNPPTIGAYEQAGNFVAPTITYTALGATLCNTNRTLNVTITSLAGINNTTAKPRIYYKKTTNANSIGATNDNTTDGWKWTETPNTTSPFTFTIDYSLVSGGVPAGATLQYFVVAQDLNATPNVGINSGTFAITPSSVQLTTSAFPISGTINQYQILSGGMTGPVNVGPGQTYLTLTGAGGLFSAINSGGLTGDLTATITGNITTEDGSVPLNTINYGCSGSAILTIKPAGNVTISGTVATGALLKLNGASNVVIDGSNNGSLTRNLNIINNTTGTSGNSVIWIASPALGKGSNNNAIKNCIIEGNAAATTFSGMYVGGSTSISLIAGGNDQNNYNTITNNLFRKTQYGLVMFGYNAGLPDTNNIVTNNNFGTSNTGEGFLLEGLHTDRQKNMIVSGNDVQNVKGSSGTAMFGIRLLDFKNGQAFNNKVHNLSYTGTSITNLVGMTVLSSTFTTSGNPSAAQIYNNLVYDLTSTGTSSTWNTTGMLASAGYGDKYYFNTVSLATVPGGTLNNGSGPCAAFANGNGTTTGICNNIDVRDNLFSITGTMAASSSAYAYYTKATTFTGITQNYNLFYAAGTGATNYLGSFNATNYATLPLWQAASSVDANSLFADPLLNSNTYVQPQTGSPAVAAGTQITGITTDITGVTRGNPPTVGAYEQAGNFAPPVISYTALANTLCATNRVLSVTVTSTSGVNSTPGTSPRIYFKKSTNANSVSATNDNTTDGWKYTEATNGASPYNFVIDYTQVFGGVAAGEIVQYFVVAQDLNITPNVGINSGTFSSIPASVALTATAFPILGTINQYQIISGGLSGSVTVGVGQTYATLSGSGGLFSAINAGGLTGTLVANIMSNITEPGAIVLNKINYGCSGSSALLIKPAGTYTLSGSSATALIYLNGASNVTIDGSLSGGTDRSLTISNTNISTASAVVWIGSASPTDGAINNTIKNCIITGNSATTTLFGIGMGGSSISVSSFGSGNNSNTIQNNNISKTQYGIYSQGASLANKNTGNIISQNVINTLAPNNVQIGGIMVGFENNIQITQNNIAGMNRTTSVFGISVGFVTSDFSASTFTGNEVTNATISKNIVDNITSTSTTGFSSMGIAYASAATGTTLISNNVITRVTDLATAPDFNAGIYVGGGSGNLQVYYNSVWLSGNRGTTASMPSYALAIGGATPTVDIRDNALENTSVSTNAAGKSYAIGLAYTSTIGNYAGLTSNYNTLFTSGTSAFFAKVGGLTTAGTDKTSLATWQAETGKDANSISSDPKYTAVNYLQPLPGSPLLGGGTSIAGLTTDINGDSRNAIPTIGAYETAHPGICPATNTSFTSNVTGTTYQWYVDDGSGAGFVIISNNAVYGGAGTSTLTITNPPTSYNGYKYRALVDGVNLSNVFTLKISVVWTGTVSTDWLNAANWSCGVVPDANTDVQINPSVPFSPVVMANVSCKSLTLKTAANVTVGAGFSINITGR